MCADRTFLVRDKRRRGFFMVFNDLYDNYGSKLGPYGLAVYMALTRYSNRESECWPSHGRIANDTGMSRRQVVRELAKIEELGLVEVDRSGSWANTYTLLDTCDSETQACDTQSQGVVPDSPKPAPRSRIPYATQAHKQDLKNKHYDLTEYQDLIVH